MNDITTRISCRSCGKVIQVTLPLSGLVWCEECTKSYTDNRWDTDSDNTGERYDGIFPGR